MIGDSVGEREKHQPGSGGDGYTYFGSNLYEELDDQGYQWKSKVINDFIIPYRIDMQGDPHLGRQFYIKYDVGTGQYMSRDL
jgi:hypothetical protein